MGRWEGIAESAVKKVKNEKYPAQSARDIYFARIPFTFSLITFYLDHFSNIH